MNHVSSRCFLNRVFFAEYVFNASLTWPPDSRLPWKLAISISLSLALMAYSPVFLLQVTSSLQAMFKYLTPCTVPACIYFPYVLSSFAFPYIGLFVAPSQHLGVHCKWRKLGVGSLPKKTKTADSHLAKCDKACSLDPSGGEVRILGRGLRDFAKATEVFARDLVTWYDKAEAGHRIIGEGLFWQSF